MKKGLELEGWLNGSDVCFGWRLIHQQGLQHS